MSLRIRLMGRLRTIDLPVLVHEMRVQQRGVRPFLIMLAYVFVLSVIAMVEIGVSGFWDYAMTADTELMSRVGRELFLHLAMAQLVMMSLAAPAFSAATVAMERERGSFDLLALTLLPSTSIVSQKLAVAVAGVVMMVVASLPVTSIVFMTGGVSPREILAVYAILLLSAVLLGSIGVFCSCITANSRTANFAAYASVIGFMVLPVMVVIFEPMFNMNLMDASVSFPLMVVAFLLFVGGLTATAIYAVLAHYVRHRTPRWRSRAFRMLSFGAVYIFAVALLTVPGPSNAIASSLYFADGEMTLTMFVSPFAAVDALVGSAGEYGGLIVTRGVPTTVVVFALACTVLLRHLSARRFEALRRV